MPPKHRPAMNRRNNRYRHALSLLAAALLLAGCSTTRRLAEGEALYTGVKKIRFEPDSGVHVLSSAESAVKAPLSVPPNNPLYSPYIRTPLPIGLWAWNYLYTPKESGLKHWLFNRLAKEPVLVSEVQPELRVKMAGDILGNYGYFGSDARYELLERKKGKKAKISYQIRVKPPFMYKSIEYPPVKGPMAPVMDSLRRTSLLAVGSQYNIDSLSAERNRITKVLRNQGYYYFRPEYLEYQADTTQQPLRVAMRMQLKQGVPPLALKPYRVGRVDITLQSLNPGPWDTIDLHGSRVAYQKPLRIRPRVLARCITLTPGETYTIDDQNSTQTNLNKLGIFRYVNLGVTELDSLRGNDSLNVSVGAGFDYPLEAELEVDVSSKSNSFVGPGATLRVSHNNLFRGGEVLSVRLKGGYEWQTGNRKRGDNSSTMNSYEFGLSGTLDFKRLLGPRFMQNTRYPSSTSFQLGVDLMNRPKFFRLISFSGSATYNFQTSPYSFHSLTLLKLVYNHLLHTTPEFDQTMDENPAIALSFKDQFIPSISYVYTFDKTYGRAQRNRIYLQNTITSAGNLIAGAIDLFGRRNPKYLFGNQFSQFVKGISEARYYYRIGKRSWLATRLLVGAGYAYGNSTVMPYSEQFYIGGANSIRAFTIRSIGPGSFHPADDDRNSYLDQTGDFKLEGNVEFRFPLMGDLHGAVFVDAGNIWLLKNDPKRPGGVLRGKTFFNDIALGTGCGLRYDLKFLVLRLDLGIAIHNPYPNPDKKGYYNIKSFKDGLALHLAIGYPF